MANIIFVVAGLLGLVFSYYNLKHPEKIVEGNILTNRNSVWKTLLGEKAAVGVARNYFAPFGVLFALILLLFGLIGPE